MEERIYTKMIKGKAYYYLQSSYREKIDTNDSGKTRGTGSSKVLTKTTYLGNAASIKKKLLGIKEPIEIKNLHFGFVSAVYKTAQETGLIDLLKDNIPGSRQGIENWKYFLIAIINRLQQATSKEKMGTWAASTVLPELLVFDPKKLNSKSFWYATDDVISQAELEDGRELNKNKDDDVFVQINDSTLRHIEKGFVKNILEKYDIDPEVVLYDTTNFFTFFSQTNESELAQTGHNKEGRHNLRQVGLAMCVEQKHGIPLYHRIYAGNSHDSHTFHQAISELLLSIKQHTRLPKDSILIIDKGNNSKENFDKLKGQLEFIGSLSVYDNVGLADIPLENYNGCPQSKKHHTIIRDVHGQELKLVLTFDDKLYRKNEHSFFNSLEKFKEKVLIKWKEYKRAPKRVPKGILTMIGQSRHKKYLKVRCRKGQPIFELVEAEVQEKKKYWGKHILFSNNIQNTAEKIIDLYGSKDKVEKSFGILKSPDLVRWIPMRHWTDSKIRAFAFTCVTSLILVRIMEIKAERADLKMSPSVIKQELMDLQKVTMVYDEKTAINKITVKSTIQKRLCELYNLDTVEHELTIQ
jgi:transposase